MPDYSKCIIYTIRTPTGLYVGSTCNYTHRKYAHKSSIHYEKSKKYNFKLYKNIRENNDEWEMKPYSEFPCENKTQMVIEEERVRRELNADLNSQSCHIDAEHQKKNFTEYQKLYYQENKEQIAEKSKQYREVNKERFAEKRKQNKQYQKEYYQKNKERFAEKNKQYQKKYREKKKAEQIN